MKKKILSLSLALVMCLSILPVTALAYVFDPAPDSIISAGVSPDRSGTAFAGRQTVYVDGNAVELNTYALLDGSGYPTNYVKLRDLAYILKDTPARFSIGFIEDYISLTKGGTYQIVGSEMSTPFSGDRQYIGHSWPTFANGTAYVMAAFMLFDDNGGGYTYYKLRDVGTLLNFNVGWNTTKAAIYVETNKPYTGEDKTDKPQNPYFDYNGPDFNFSKYAGIYEDSVGLFTVEVFEGAVPNFYGVKLHLNVNGFDYSFAGYVGTKMIEGYSAEKWAVLNIKKDGTVHLDAYIGQVYSPGFVDLGEWNISEDLVKVRSYWN